MEVETRWQTGECSQLLLLFLLGYDLRSVQTVSHGTDSTEKMCAAQLNG